MRLHGSFPRPRRRLRRAPAALAAVLTGVFLLAPRATSTADRPGGGTAAATAVPARWLELERAVDRLRDRFHGEMSIYIEELATGRSLAFDAERPVPAASLIKVPIAVTLMEQVRAGRVDLGAAVTLRSSDKAGGSGVLRRRRSGTQLTVGELLELMLQRSDNTATNILTDLLGLDAINGTCGTRGLAATCMSRYVMDLEARDRKIENFTSAVDMARLFRGLYRGSVVDAEKSARLLEVLKGQKVRDRLPRFLPVDAVVANKTGLMNHLCHDAGIIFGTAGDYFVAVLTEDFRSFGSAKAAIGSVGRMVWRYDAGEPIDPPPARPARRG